MFQRRANVEAIDAMRGKGGALRRGVVDDDTGSRDSKWCPIKVEVSKEAGMGGQLGLSTR